MRRVVSKVSVFIRTLLLAGLCIIITGCDQATDVAEKGFSEEGLNQIQEKMETAIADGRIMSGIAVVMRDGEVIWLGTAGEMGPGVPMSEDPIIPLASVGKMFTATAAMILYENGVISLDDPVSKYIPEFADVKVGIADESGKITLIDLDKPVTIYHLLTHTGGLNVNGVGFQEAWDTHAGRTTTLDLAKAVAEIPLQTQPGTKFDYGWGGGSYEVLAAVIEIASGQTLEEFMTENIFEPLDLNDSYFYAPDEKSDRVPAFYRKVDGELQQDRAYGEDFPRTTYFHGGGGVRSAPKDILRFAQIFINDGSVDGVQLLQPKTIQLMMTDHLGELSPWGGELSWGFGSAVRNFVENVKYFGLGTPGQYGWVGGGYAKLWVDPKEKLIVYIAFPLTPPGDMALLTELSDMVYAAMMESYIDP